jgi:radical SAM superfamily enzyme YgiQ (UPF0313 family)
MANFVHLLPLIEKEVALEEADYILYMHSFARVQDMWRSVEHDLEEIDTLRKPGAEIIVMGKACNIKSMLSRKIDNITYLEDNFIRQLGERFGYRITGKFYALDDDRCKMSLWPVDGCFQSCAFCRRRYMNIPFHSVPLEKIKMFLDYFKNNDPQWLQIISLRAENLTEYGMDLYGERRLYEVLELLNRYEEIKAIEMPIGICIGELSERDIEAICKLKAHLANIAMNVEVGTDRLLKVINKSHTVDRAREAIKRIRRAHPEVDVGTTVLVGVPTEELADIDALADLLIELTFDWVQINILGISDRSPLAKLEQLSPSLVEYHKNRLVSQLKKAGREICEGKLKVEKFHRKTERCDGHLTMIVKYPMPKNRCKSAWMKCLAENEAHPYSYPMYIGGSMKMNLY